MNQRRLQCRSLVLWSMVSAVAAGGGLVASGQAGRADRLDAQAERWVRTTLARMSVEERIGQLIVPSFESVYTSSDSETFDRLVGFIRRDHVGGFHAFGGSRPAPGVLLNPAYSTVTLGQPFDAASILNRLQAVSTVPLLNTADFEAGVGFRLEGATVFPRSMAFGAAGDDRLAYEAGRVTAVEARAVGIHVNFAPVVDVNNNARNPVINTRSFGENPDAVARLASAYVRGLRAGGMLATLKHFPGHGDTDVDSHLGLPIIRQPRERLDAIELLPFRAGIEAGADAVMTAHIVMPALDPAPETPATFSRAIVTDLLRGQLGFGGLVYTDSLSMQAIANLMSPGQAAVRAVEAGNDVVLHSPDPDAAFDALRAAVGSGEIPQSRIDASVDRILRAKARLDLMRAKSVSLDALPAVVGGRDHRAVAEEVSRRSITLLKDDRSQVPLHLPVTARVLYLSVLDYTAGWGIASPSRTFAPELRSRWPNVTAVELSDRSTPDELDLVRAMAPGCDAIVASVFVRTAAYSGRMDLAPHLVRLLHDLVPLTATSGAPYVAVLFGNPYTATFLPTLPAILVTYDYYDLAERSAVRALAGEAAIEGRLPITLPGLFPVGHGLDRPERD